MSDERTPTAPRGTVAYAGIAISSRYSQRDELERMMRAVDHVADDNPHALALITTIFCDSKGQCAYSVQCCREQAACSEGEIRAVAAALDMAFRAVAGGHNGIDVGPLDPDGSVFVEPYWYEGE